MALNVELHNQLRNPQAIPATRILVRDEHDNPICLVVQDGQFIHIKRVGDHDFEKFLQMYGITRTIIVTNLDGKVPEIQI
jgi:hypothetical protein